ncbi:integrase [Bradyrhizobium sp. NAS80.1]|uniref:site-specific integrase n=1 Tax=Bradyrhizobium sp. NAS80.1 TaxID=1680159 RepID=UPI0009622D9B|nr:site-specific integrase [Bradyrhizobium sp. NAS80.1]OKO80157.1 integrase [Bradyrhizobium sp. NAS80.1]
MSIRKREWKTASGEDRQAWVVDYTSKGKRHLRTFNKKKEAETFETEMRGEVRDGTHTPRNKSLTVSQAGENWISASETAGLERTTIDGYRQHLDLHISPFVGNDKLADLAVADVRALEDKLAAEGRSKGLIRKVRVSLGSILADAQERGHVARNVVRELGRSRRKGKEKRAEGRQKGKLRVGVDIPSPAEIALIIAAMPADGKWRSFFLVAIFTGLRASELRGLRWQDVNLKKGEISVTQRVDAYQEAGAPKSESGHRIIPMPPNVVASLKAWKLACPKGDLDLVFPSDDGTAPMWHANIINRAWCPLQIAAGVSVQVRDENGKLVRDDEGKPVMQAKYTGLHALRHFYASWCINSREDGGLGLSAKVLQERLGHATIQLTLDTYSHLFPRGDDSAKLADAESRLFGNAT